MADARLGPEKTEILRRWGHGLAASGRDDEMRAAGRAILLLAEEIDALQRDLWHARAHVSADLPGASPEPQPQRPVERPEPSDALRLIDALTMRLAEHLPTLR